MKAAKDFWAFLTKPDVYWRLFALLLAIVLWLLAAGDGSLGEEERTVTLQVQTLNLPGELVLVEPPEPVDVRIRGLSPLLNQGASSIVASINLSGAKAGTEMYNVEVTGPLGIEIVRVSPSWVSVYTEEVQEAVFPVTLVILGVEQGRQVSGLEPDPAVVTLRGAESVLREVDHVIAYADLGDGIGPDSLVPVRALDDEGRGLYSLEIDPPRITMRLKRDESTQTREE